MIEFMKTIFCKHEWCEPFMVGRYQKDNIVPYEKKNNLYLQKVLKKKRNKTIKGAK
jgi:hypothetical protein